MKVIDLLNKIANGEEVPKKVKYKNFYWEYREEEKDYKDNEGDYVFGCSNYDITEMLNTEVEILEENKIPEKWNDLSFTTMRKKEDSIDDDIQKLKGYIETIMRTQNQVIDYLKSKGDE